MAEKLEIIIHAKDQFSRTMKSLRGMLPGLKKLALGAGAAVGGLGTGLYAVAQSTAKAGDEFQKMSLRLGLSSEMLSGMKHAVELSGSSMESFEKGVRTLAKRMSDADEGLAEAERSFEALGIEVKNADGTLKDLDSIMAEASEGLAKMEDNTKRVALAQELFGRSGTQLLPLMKQGAEGLRKMQEEAHALGITFDKVSADQAAEFQDNMLRLRRVFTGIKTQIGQAIIPLFSEMAATGTEAGKRLVHYIRQNKDEIQSYAKTFLTAIGEMAEKGAYGIALLADSWRGWQEIWYVLEISFAHFAKTLWEGLHKIRGAVTWTLETFNFKGIFDDMLTNSRRIFSEQETIIRGWEDVIEEATGKLDKLLESGLAIHKVTDIMGLIKASIEEIRAAAKTNGIPPFDDETIDTTKTKAQEFADFIADLKQRMYEEDLNRLQAVMDEQDRYIQEGLDKQKAALEELNAWKRAVTDETARAMQRNFSDLFFDIFTGELKTIEDYFKAFTRSLLRAFSDMVAQMLIKIAVLKAAMAFGGGGGFLGGLFHEGGVVGKTKVPMRLIPLDMQPIPRLHAGLGPNEFPAILERGETVIPKDAGPGGITQIVNVHNEILPNAGNVESLLQMSKKDWERVIEDRIIPAMTRLKFAGIKP